MPADVNESAPFFECGGAGSMRRGCGRGGKDD